MASLKEVKTRIGSVESIRKITQARQMVSSAEFHRAQIELENAKTYKQTVDSMLAGLSASYPSFRSPLLEQRSGGAVALIAMSSNSGMAGSFNSRIIKEVADPGQMYEGEKVLLYPFGRKIREAWARTGFKADAVYDRFVDKPDAGQVSELVDDLVKQYLDGRIKRVDIVSFHFKSLGTQQIAYNTLLPFSMPEPSEVAAEQMENYYILEPSGEELMRVLLPLSLVSNFYTILTDNRVSEHAARMLAMQTATENANELLEELRLTYNKVRQQNITSELLDIIGTSFA